MTADSEQEPKVGFADLGLSPETLETLKAIRYVAPSPIQAAFIPKALQGVDCTGQAQTGTGKTAAFMLPVLERISAADKHVQALILTPTRELSEQVAAETVRLAGNRPVHPVCCVGGKQIKRQIDALKRGGQIVIGTPGRVLDLINRRLLVLDQLKIAILDEADRMLDIGFRPDIEKILKRCPTDRQTLLLSATMPPPVERLAHRYMRNPDRVDLSTNQVVVDTVDQYYVTVDFRRKISALVHLLVDQKPRQAIVFCRTKRGADKLHDRLSSRLPNVAIIHGDLPQSTRDRAMKQFRDGTTRLLIATDVVGRGIDVTGVSHIINYDVPEYCDDYIHRIGRTGRMSSGDTGYAFTFVARDEGQQLTNIEKRIDRLLPQYVLPGLQPEVRIETPTATVAIAAPAPEVIEEEEEDFAASLFDDEPVEAGAA